ncbi:MAG TPA: PQQ-binding-like beta-propeller repeat protein [Verrucomicrobiae bacterium]
MHSERKVWLTTATSEDRSLRAVGLDAQTGAILVNQEVFALEATPAKHRVNNPAAPTPVVGDGRVYVSFGTHGVACLSTTNGAVLWTNTELKFHDEEMGPGSSPILANDLLIVSCDGTDNRFIAGLDIQTGKVKWKTERSNRIATAVPYRKSFSTPVFAQIGGTPQIISSSSYRVFGYNPESGSELWAVEIPGFCPIPVPIIDGNTVYVCTGYNKAELWALEWHSNEAAPKRAWKSTRSIPLISSPVLVSDYLFFVSQEGIASCVEKNSGDLIWNERLRGTYWASPVQASGKIYFSAENGTVTVVRASPEFKVLGRNSVDGEIMATPALEKAGLLLRTKTHLYRITQQTSANANDISQALDGIDVVTRKQG